MNPVNIEKWAEPLRAIAELNLKTMQEMSYMKPEELTSIKNPQDIFEKQIKIAMDNGYKALEHMQKSFQIIEKAMLSMVPEEGKGVKVSVEEVKRKSK